MRLALLALTLAAGPAPPSSGPHTISGTTRYVDGRPVAGCRVLVLHPAFEPLAETRCDAEGRYRLTLEEGTYNAIAILDEGYGKTTLEFWGWNVRVDGDLTLDATIDRLEVYGLAAWPSRGGSRSLFVTFRPMALDRALAQEPPRREVVAGDTLLVTDLSPALRPESVLVSLDGTPLEVLSLQWYYERYVDRGTGAPRHMRVALLQLNRPDLAEGGHLLRVRITDARSGAVGEGVIAFSSNRAGLGF